MPNALQKQFQKIPAHSAKCLDCVGAKKEGKDHTRNLGGRPLLPTHKISPHLHLTPECVERFRETQEGNCSRPLIQALTHQAGLVPGKRRQRPRESAQDCTQPALNLDPKTEGPWNLDFCQLRRPADNP